MRSRCELAGFDVDRSRSLPVVNAGAPTTDNAGWFPARFAWREWRNLQWWSRWGKSGTPGRARSRGSKFAAWFCNVTTSGCALVPAAGSAKPRSESGEVMGKEARRKGCIQNQPLWLKVDGEGDFREHVSRPARALLFIARQFRSNRFMITVFLNCKHSHWRVCCGMCAGWQHPSPFENAVPSSGRVGIRPGPIGQAQGERPRE